MTIYILDKDPTKIAEYLDDKSLKKMIASIAQAICDAHHNINYNKHRLLNVDTPYNETQAYNKVPLSPSYTFAEKYQWSKWIIECVANYNYLVELGLIFVTEISNRQLRSTIVKYYVEVLWWAPDNVPDLPTKCRCKTSPICMSNECDEYETEFPLVMPKKYIYHKVTTHGASICDYVYHLYRNYYQEKIKQKTKCDVDPEILKRHDDECEGHYENIKWTSREKPDWLIL